MMFGTNFVAAALAASVLFGAVAHAEQNDQGAEIAAATTAKIDAVAAIGAVEKQGNGKVVELALEGHGAAVTYAVTLMAADGTETNYVVDALTGAVVQTGEAWSDQKDGGEVQDDGPNAQDMGDGDGETNDDGPNGGQDQGDGDGETND
jgi:hypothetical protein